MINSDIKQKGFTLVEVLISLVLLSMISLVGYGGVIFSIKQWHKSEQKIDSLIERMNSLSFLREQLSRVKDKRNLSGNKQYVSFAGENKKVKYVGKFGNIQQSGLYVCELSLTKERNLEIAYGYLHPEADDFLSLNLQSRQTVYNGVKSVSYWYFGSKDGQPHGWHNTWLNQQELPRMIRYKVVFEEGRELDNIIYVEA